MSYKFSIVIAVYNTEKYLEETIESVVNQTFGFENIQLILVNDGSRDNSADVCRKYEERYPENVRFIDKENGGVSSARNIGLDIATGEFINFLDSDDLLDVNTCTEVVNFFAKYGEETDVASIPMQFFDGQEGEHILNDKFKKTRVVDLKEEISAIQLSSSSAFVRADAIGSKRFREDVKYGEDLELISRILLEKFKLGVIKEATYWYRRRLDGASAIQSSALNRDYYLSYTENVQEGLFKYSLERLGYYPRYLQYQFLYDMKWRVCSGKLPDGVLTEEEQHQIYEITQRILQSVDTDVILTHSKLIWKDKEFYLGLKNGRKIKELYQYVRDREQNDVMAVIDGHIVDRLSQRRIWIQNIVIENDRIRLEGTWSRDYLTDDTTLYIAVGPEGEEENVNIYPLIETDGWICDSLCWGEVISKPYYFITPWVPVEENTIIHFEAGFSGMKILLKAAFGASLSYLNQEKAFRILEKHVITFHNHDQIQIQKADKNLLLEMEDEYEDQVRKTATDDSKELDKLLKLRKDYIDSYYFSAHKKVWLFSDRIDAPDDNGEHIFRYCREHAQEYPDVEMFFILQKASPDFERMKQYGAVVDYDSEESLELFLRADMIISSQANLTTYSPYGKSDAYVKGLQEHKKIFLQHGITKDDLSKWLHRWNKGLDIFVTAAEPEYASVVNGKYGYSDKQVRLSGFPRFDSLQDEKEKVILFMPTWDSKLASFVRSDGRMVQVYNEKFKDSELFREIDSLLSSKRLETLLEKYHYKFLLKPHPNLMVQISDFTLSEHMSVAKDISYQDCYKKGALLITDYSSTQFDFAYMKKPVLYLQTRENHLETGYYNYETMGLGEVCKSLDVLLDHMEEYLKEDCRMKDLYQSRVDHFFKYTDRNNCKRLSDILKEFM